MSQEFAGRRVIITGGASGIGCAVAKSLVDSGATVYLFDLSTQAIADAEKQLGKAACGHLVDVTSEKAVKDAFSVVRKQGPIDGLVCCAGIPDIPAKAEDIDLRNWNRVMQTHLTGTFNACRIVGEGMLKDGGGAIVNLASVLSFNAGPVAAYGAAKAAIVNLTSSLAVQWAKRHVRVNAVAPGWTDTPFLRPKEREGTRDLTPILAATPLGRLLAPEEISEVIVFLLSPKSSGVVGTTVVCDGGVIAGAGWFPYGGFPD
jgi:NAD(P)-dependent dehydrogenase (short-subunit alcohol dehydrogenase family)